RTTHSWQTPITQNMPRGARSIGLVRSARMPASQSAIATVWPARAVTGRPSNSKSIEAPRPPGVGPATPLVLETITPLDQDALHVVGLERRHGLASGVFGRQFALDRTCQCQRNVRGNDDDPIVVAQHEVAGMHLHAVADDRHVDCAVIPGVGIVIVAGGDAL